VSPKENKVEYLQQDEKYGGIYWGREFRDFLLRAMKNNPGYLTEEFEFLFFNDDVLHTSWVKYIIHGLKWRQADYDGALDQLIDLIAKAPIFQFSSDVSTDPANGYAVMERNKFVLPDLFLVKGQFCSSAFPSAKTAQEQFKWEDKIEKAFFIGKPTGFGQDYYYGYDGKNSTFVRDTLL
jgi:hypothetical protein